MVTSAAPIVVVLTHAPANVDLIPLSELAAQHDVRWIAVDIAANGTARARFHAGSRPPRFILQPGIARDDVVAEALRPLLTTTTPGVILPLDRAAVRAAHLLRDDLPDHVVVGLVATAERIAILMGGGRTAASLRYPAPPDAKPSNGSWLRLDDSSAGRWLDVRGDTVTVRTAKLAPSAQAAIRERSMRRPGERRDRGHLLVAPANYAGQGWAWAQSVRRHAPGWGARNVAVYSAASRLAFPADRQLSADQWTDPVNRVEIAASEIVPATHVLLEAMRPVAGMGRPDASGWGVRAALDDIEALLESGRKVALLFHGSEVREPVRHSLSSVWSPFDRAGRDETTARLENMTKAVRVAREGLDLPMFVSTPDLLDYVPHANWLPVALMPGDFAPPTPLFAHDRPVVLHAPSSSRLKGSSFVDDVLDDLEGRGIVHYRRLSGLPPLLIPHALRQADIVIDQVVLGNPGVFAAQALAAGRVVLSHLPDTVRRRYPVEPPVIEATPLSLRSVLLDIVSDLDAARAVASRGPAFAHDMHDGRRSADALRAGFLESTGSDGSGGLRT